MHGIYVITGGAGFLGRALARALIAGGAKVRVLDRNASPMSIATACETVVTDLKGPAVLEAALSGATGCFHLATHAPEVLAATALGRVPVVLASSAAVYGVQPDRPVHEDAVLAPQTPYGVEKLAAENAARAIHAAEGLPVLGLRFFNLYGPGQDPDRPLGGVVAKFARALAAGDALPIAGDGNQKRDFMFVDDGEAYLRAGMDFLLAHGGCRFLNACTGQPTTVLELAAELQAVAGRRAPLAHLPPCADEIRWSYGSPDAAQEFLAVRPRVTLKAGLELTYRGQV